MPEQRTDTASLGAELAIGGHVFDTLRALHAHGGPLLALLGAVPTLKLRRRSQPAVMHSDAIQKNRHFPVDLSKSKPYRPEATRILSGDPVQTATYLFASNDKRFSVGTWTCQRGKWRIDFGEHEFIHILDGVVDVTDAEGEVRTYRAGDTFVSPLGFSGTWDVIEPVMKHFVLYAEPAPESVSLS